MATAGDLECGSTVLGLQHAEAALLQKVAGDIPAGAGVFNDEYGFHWWLSPLPVGPAWTRFH